MIKIENFHLDKILLDEKSYKNILIYEVLHKTFIFAESLCIIFDKVNVFIRDYGETKYLVLFETEKYDAIFQRIRYFIGL